MTDEPSFEKSSFYKGDGHISDDILSWDVKQREPRNTPAPWVPGTTLELMGQETGPDLFQNIHESKLYVSAQMVLTANPYAPHANTNHGYLVNGWGLFTKARLEVNSETVAECTRPNLASTFMRLKERNYDNIVQNAERECFFPLNNDDGSFGIPVPANYTPYTTNNDLVPINHPMARRMIATQGQSKKFTFVLNLGDIFPFVDINKALRGSTWKLTLDVNSNYADVLVAFGAAHPIGQFRINKLEWHIPTIKPSAVSRTALAPGLGSKHVNFDFQDIYTDRKLLSGGTGTTEINVSGRNVRAVMVGFRPILTDAADSQADAVEIATKSVYNYTPDVSELQLDINGALFPARSLKPLEAGNYPVAYEELMRLCDKRMSVDQNSYISIKDFNTVLGIFALYPKYQENVFRGDQPLKINYTIGDGDHYADIVVFYDKSVGILEGGSSIIKKM